MNKYIILVLAITLCSCKETFDTRNPAKFNAKIADSTNIKTAEDLITLYYNYPKNEGTPKLTTETNKLSNGEYQVTLIHDELEDDSQRAIKIIMTAKKAGNKWLVLSIKANYKCWDGRGHSYWSSEYCN